MDIRFSSANNNISSVNAGGSSSYCVNVDDNSNSSTELRKRVKSSRKRRIESDSSDNDDISSEATHIISKREPDNISEDNEYSNNNLYGLKPAFLKALGITPPLEKWVHVSNFRCDKSELKEVMELAGQVVICSCVNVRTKHAKVMYSHPLEAVQAVTMLNGQTFYGQKLQVYMVRCPTDTVILPKGLSNVGPGLGKNGRPIRDIAKQYKKYINGDDTLLDRRMFVFWDADDVKEDSFKEILSENMIKPFRVTNVDELDDVSQSSTDCKRPKLSPLNRDSTTDKSESSNSLKDEKTPKIGTIEVRGPPPRPLGTQLGPNIPPQQSYPNPIMGAMNIGPTIRPAIGPMNPVPPVGFNPNAPNIAALRPGLPPQNVPQAMIPPVRNPSIVGAPAVDPAQRAVPPRMPTAAGPTTLHFNNLPPSTTFPLLCERLAHCGQVLSLQLTTPGCAVATFASKAQADRCFQVFNGKFVDGFVIGVRYI